ncbi:MAG: single-stranded DNA-binding protein [Patescibacteria group bacterium]|nr:single-stranded DNA-binding protein [Patescibacteria group bacterium]
MSSRSLNKVLLIGNLTRDPELRYTPQGTPVCTFGLATNRSWQPSAGGERQEETEFHRIVAWNKLAELCAELLFKGRKVFVEGRVQTRNWTDAQGQERTTVEVVIDNMIVLDNKHKDNQEDGGNYQQNEYADEVSAVPANDETVTPLSQPQSEVDHLVVEKTDKIKKSPVKPKTEEPKIVEPKVEIETADEKINPDEIPF